ncbi:hypothetical protein Fcan01_26924 [Folsomia candida]|uniref:CUB domain-containing protein n=1 Tax=Folsomia candida TaxID=158441 RepID=A0A226D0L2_FOLCA|nr:hypothetical protein Fcan01_26924 [Folsomia candida]
MNYENISYFSLFLLFLQISLLFLAEATAHQNVGGSGKVLSESSSRNPKRMYWPFVSYIVSAGPCGDGDGICLPGGKCKVQGGRKIGECGSGLGDCCRFSMSCDETTSRREINEITSTISSPSPITADCQFIVKRKPKYCQIRLDFTEYISSSANLDGVCDVDSFTVKGSSTVSGEFTTCGTLTGQHMYLEFGDSDSIQIIPSFSSGGNNAKYRILVTQIACKSPQRVPSYCLQNYPSGRGVVKSFDFPKQQQNNQRYTVCVAGVTSDAIMWNLCSAADAGTGITPFFISGPAPANQDHICHNTRDWVQPNGRNQICLAETAMKPFTLNVNFNDHEVEPLPCPLLWQGITDPDQCTLEAVQLANPNNACARTRLQSCTWIMAALRCICNPIESDNENGLSNTGFCLSYGPKSAVG